MGLSVVVANNGREAVDQVQAGDFDLILMDLSMPVMGGIEACTAIRALPGRQAMPILAMTANAFNEDRQRCLAAGMQDHVAKPVNPAVLYQALLRWLPARGPRPASEALAAPPMEEGGGALLQIPGLDAAQGLLSVRGRHDRYIHLITLFSDAHRHDGATLRNQLADNRLEEIGRCAHSLKGTAGTIGALALSQQAMDVEQASRNKMPPRQLAELVEALARDLEVLVQAIDQARPTKA